MNREVVLGRLVLEDGVEPGRVEVEADRIVAVEPDAAGAAGPFVAPGFVDLHVHGWGGHDAVGPEAALDRMSRALLRGGVTSFLPTAVTAPLDELARFATRVRRWSAVAPIDGAQPLGFNLEGPFLSAAKRGAQNAAFIRAPEDVAVTDLEPLVDGLRVATVAPEVPGALDLIGWLRERGVAPSLGHSEASASEAFAGYDAGAVGTTHLFNGMSGVDHHAPGLAAAALARDDIFVELIADGHHVDRALWPIIFRAKPTGRVILISDAVWLAGTDNRSGQLGGLEVTVEDGRCTLASDGRLASSLIALGDAVRNVVAAGIDLPVAVAAASRNPLAMLGVHDRGRLAPGQRADLVELDDGLGIRRVMRAGRWFETRSPDMRATRRSQLGRGPG
jgi:N-acetylglucosamine-6-phosphate deacetylase